MPNLSLVVEETAENGQAQLVEYRLTIKGAARLYANSLLGSEEEKEALEILKQLVAEAANG